MELNVGDQSELVQATFVKMSFECRWRPNEHVEL